MKLSSLEQRNEELRLELLSVYCAENPDETLDVIRLKEQRDSLLESQDSTAYRIQELIDENIALQDQSAASLTPAHAHGRHPPTTAETRLLAKIEFSRRFSNEEGLRARLLKTKSLLTSATARADDLTAELARTQQELAAMAEQYAEVSEENAQNLEYIRRWMSERSQPIDAEALRELRERTERGLQWLTADLQLDRRLTAERAKHEIELNEHKQEIKRLKGVIAGQQVQNKGLRVEVATRGEIIEQVHIDLAEVKDLHQQEMEDFRSRHRELQLELESVKSALADAHSVIVTQRAAINTQAKEEQQLRLQIEEDTAKSKEEIGRLRNHLSAERGKHELERKTAKETMEALREEIRQTEDENSRLREPLANAIEKVNALTPKLKAATAENADLQTKLNEAVSEVERLTAELNQKTGENANLQSDLKTALRTVDALRNVESENAELRATLEAIEVNVSEIAPKATAFDVIEDNTDWLRNELKAAKEQLQIQSAANAEYEQKIAELEREVCGIEKLTLQVSELQLKLAQAEVAASRHQCPLDWEHWETRLHARTLELRQKQDEVVDIRRALAEIEEADRAKAKEIHHLKLRLEFLNTAPAEVKRLQHANAELRRKIAALGRDLQAEKGGKLITTRQNEVLRMESEKAIGKYEVGRDLLQQKQTEVETLAALLEHTKGEVWSARDEMAELRREYAENIEKVERLQRRVLNLTHQMEEKKQIRDEICVHNESIGKLAAKFKGDDPLESDVMVQTAAEIYRECQELSSQLQQLMSDPADLE